MREQKQSPDVSQSKSERMKASAENRKRKKRRAEFRIGVFVLFLILVVAVVFSVFFFKVEDITVRNDAIRYSDAQILELAGIETEESLLILNTGAISARIEKSLPYIGSAKIKRQIPDKVEIIVEYTKATIAVEGENGYVLLDNSGKVLQTGVQMLSDYTAVLYGGTLKEATPGEKVVFEEADLLTYITGLSKSFEKYGFNNVTAYDLTDISDVIVEVNYNTDLKLGSVSKAESKLKFGKEVIDRTIAQTRSSTSKLVVDLTTENTAYVRTQDDIDAAKEAARRAQYNNSLKGEEDTTLSDGETLPDEPSSAYDGEAAEAAGEDAEGAEETSASASLG